MFSAVTIGFLIFIEESIPVLEVEAASTRAERQRRGRMDRAWFLLMLHCGLRVGEVCRLRLSELDTSTSLSAGLEGRRVRIERSKHLKDRVVYLSDAAAAALEAYLEVRGPVATDHVFAYRHKPLSPGHCNRRLATYAKRCGVRVTTHQLRHSAATLLLNAGAPILTVQALLGHRHIDTTLGYARLYDGTVAADYYQAMAGIEHRLELGDATQESWLNAGQLLALVDSLHDGTLNQAQKETVQALRTGILALAEASDPGL